MKLQDFIKDLFSQPAADGYEIGRIEVGVSIDGANDIVVDDGRNPSCAKVVIVPTVDEAVQAVRDAQKDVSKDIWEGVDEV